MATSDSPMDPYIRWSELITDAGSLKFKIIKEGVYHAAWEYFAVICSRIEIKRREAYFDHILRFSCQRYGLVHAGTVRGFIVLNDVDVRDCGIWLQASLSDLPLQIKAKYYTKQIMEMWGFNRYVVHLNEPFEPYPWKIWRVKDAAR